MALGACARDATTPDDSEVADLGEVSQALVGEGGWCGPPSWPDCDADLTCCNYSGFPTTFICRDLRWDDDNCGGCGHECTGYYDFCNAGVCVHFGE